MKIISAEFKKLFSNRIFVICFVLFLVVNLSCFYFLNTNDERYKYDLSLSDKLQEGFEAYSDMDTKKAINEIKLKCTAYQMASQLESTANNDFDAEYIEELNRQFKEENPKAYKQATNIIKQGFSVDDYYIIQALQNKYDYIDEYKTFIDDMQARTDKQLEFSIFSKPGTFAYNNIEQTPQSFAHLKDLKITPGFDLGFNLSTSFVMTDYLLIVLVLICAITLFSAEGEKGLFILVKSTKNGRVQTCLSKLAVMLLTTSGIVLVYYISNLCAGNLLFGLGDLNRSIQSIPEFMNCNLKCTVIEYLALWITKKIAVMCVIALISALLFTLIKNSGITFAGLLLFLGLEFSLYNFTDSRAYFNHIKYINLFYYLDGNELWGNYLNLSFFTQPVNTGLVFIVVCLVIFLIAVPVCVISFSLQTQITSRNIISKFSEKIRLKFQRCRGNTSVIYGEAYKHYFSSKAVIVIFIAVLFAYSNLTENIEIIYNNGADVAYAAYMNKLSGELTDEKEDFIKSEQEYFEQLNIQKESIVIDSSLSEDEKTAKINAIDNIIETRGAGFDMVLSQYDTIKRVGEQIGSTPCFIDHKLSTKLMSDFQREWIYFSLFLILLIFSCSGIFAYENKRKMCDLICASKNGKGKLVLSKLVVAMVTFSVLYILIYLPYMLNFIKTFGADIFKYPLAFAEGFENLQSSISIFGGIVFEGALHMAIGLLALSVIMLFSSKMKSIVTVMIVSSAILIIPCMLVFFSPELRLFSLFKSDQIVLMAIISVVSIFLTILINTVIYRTFTHKSRSKSYGVKNFKHLQNI